MRIYHANTNIFANQILSKNILYGNPSLFYCNVIFYRIHLLGEAKWGCKKCRRIPKCEGDWQGRVPKCSLPRKKPLQNKGFGAPKFSGISPKLCAALRRIHPYFPVAKFSFDSMKLREFKQSPKISFSACKRFLLRWYTMKLQCLNMSHSI